MAGLRHMAAEKATLTLYFWADSALLVRSDAFGSRQPRARGVPGPIPAGDSNCPREWTTRSRSISVVLPDARHQLRLTSDREWRRSPTPIAQTIGGTEV